MIANLVYHYLVTLHHGSHYDWHVWLNWYRSLQHDPSLLPSRAVSRVLDLLGKGGI